MIELKNICYEVFDEKTQKTKQILKDINLKFPKNKLTVITGHNGSGKSTLVKIIMGIIKQTSGEVFFDGKNIDKLSISERAKAGITIAFQQPVRLNVENLLNLASGEKTNISKACEYLAQVGLCAKDYLKREVDNTLSGGELKRIELAIALAKGGDVLLFDEPEAGIDLWSFDDLTKIFKKLKNKTVIVVSHQKKILEMADYILLLNTNSNAILDKRDKMMKELSKPQCAKLGGVING